MPRHDFSISNRFDRVVILHGHKAGRGSGRDQLHRLYDLCHQDDLNAVMTDDLNAAQQFIEPSVTGPSENGSALIVAAGGDGTLALAASMAENGGHVVVPMPMGTENLLARHYGHSAKAESVMAAIRGGKVETIDSMLLYRGNRERGQRSLIMASIGFDADVVRRMHLTRKGHIRRVSYATPIWSSVRRYAFPELTVRLDDGEPMTCGWLMVFNLPRYAASLAIETNSDPSDGLLEVLAWKGRSISSGLRYAAGVAMRQHGRFSDVTRFLAKKIEVASPKARPALQSDGDYVGKIPVTIRCDPESVKLLIPSVTMRASDA